ncbi:hypothetical protein ACHAXN_011066 [Cyclotella atomus]|jgi:hypothetical protein
MQFTFCAGAFILLQNVQQQHSTHKQKSGHVLCSSERNFDGIEGRSLSNASNTQSRRQRKKKRRRWRSNFNEQNQFLQRSIDSFLAGDYAHRFSPDAPAPNPLLSAGRTVDTSLRALRELDTPYPCHGAAIFLRFCIPLSRAERLGGNDPWKNILRSSLTPAMLARNIRASSQFSCLFDWTSLDVMEGVSNPNPSRWALSGRQATYVNAGLFFEYGPPEIVHFALKTIGGAWFIDSIHIGAKEKVELPSWDIGDDE